MAKDKKGFILYCDVIHTVEKLTDEQAGKLFKHILKYVNDQDPIPEDIITEIAFEPIKQSLKRDLQKYEGIRVKNKENALKRWNATASERIPTDAKNAVIDKDSVIVKDNKYIYIPEFDEFLQYAIQQVPNVNKEQVKLKYESWKVNEWKDGNDKPIKNWKSKLNQTLPYISKIEVKQPRQIFD
jgi:hypothetical protein